jgi:hypothetical protein
LAEARRFNPDITVKWMKGAHAESPGRAAIRFYREHIITEGRPGRADRLGAMRGPGESYSDAILRLVGMEDACVR